MIQDSLACKIVPLSKHKVWFLFECSEICEQVCADASSSL